MWRGNEGGGSLTRLRNSIGAVDEAEGKELERKLEHRTRTRDAR